MLSRWFPTFFAQSTHVTVRDFVARYRRPLIAALSALLLLAIVGAIRGSRPTVEVVVALNPISAGEQLGAADVTVKRVPTAAGSGAATSTSDVVGRTSLVALQPGQPIYASFTIGRTSIPGGQAAVPLRPADAASAITVHAGERVDVIGQRTADDAASVLARNVTVLAITAPKTSGLLKSAVDTPMVIVITDPYTASELARASLAGPVAFTMRS